MPICNLIEDANPRVNVSKKKFSDELALPNILDVNPFKLEMSSTWTTRIEALKYGAQFQCITVENKERIEHRIRQSDLPAKPPTDRHSTNSTKEHKSLNVPHLWSYRSQVSLFNLDEKLADLFSKRVKICLKIKLLQKVLIVRAYSACLFAVEYITWRNSGELFILKQIKLPCEWMTKYNKEYSSENIRDIKRATNKRNWAATAGYCYLKTKTSLRFRPNHC